MFFSTYGFVTLQVCHIAAAAAKLLQSCLTLQTHRRQPTRLPCPWDSPGKNNGVGCISFSNAWKWKVKVKLLSCVQLLVTPWTAAYQTLPSMGFSRHFTFMHWRRKCNPWMEGSGRLHPLFLPGESQGWASLVAAIYGVAQSRTRLKWLSSSSSSKNIIHEDLCECFQYLLC